MNVVLCAFALSLCFYAVSTQNLILTQKNLDSPLLKHLSSWAELVPFENNAQLVPSTNYLAILGNGDFFMQYSDEIFALLDSPSPPYVILTDVDPVHKDILNQKLGYVALGPSHIYGILPFTDANKLSLRRYINVANRGNKYREKHSAHSPYKVSTKEDVDESAKIFSDEIYATLESGVYVAANNMTPPAGALYNIIPTTQLASYSVNFAPFTNPGTQTVSHRIDNTYYNYRENGFGEDAYYCVLLQDGIVSPGTEIETGNAAIGYYQYAFLVSNQPYPNGQIPDGNSFYWAQSSPATVNQEISETTTATESLSIGIDMQINGNGGISESTTWTANYQQQSDITQWGILETTNPVNSSTSWIYHQQVPYDPYELGWNNFPSWYSEAYQGKNGDSVLDVPDLSQNTLQVHTTSVWYAAGSLRITNGTLPLTVNTFGMHEVAFIAAPGYFDSHHTAFYAPGGYSDSSEMNLAYFPSSN